MDQFKSIEDKLARLVPPALSCEGQRKLEDLIDNLSEADEPRAKSHFHIRPKGLFWAAAAVLFFSASIVLVRPALFSEEKKSLTAISNQTDHARGSEMVVLTSTKLIDGRKNDGLIVPIDGASPHYRYRYHVIDEEQVKDPDSGLVITLRQPRQEILTIPVTQF